MIKNCFVAGSFTFHEINRYLVLDRFRLILFVLICIRINTCQKVTVSGALSMDKYYTIIGV